MTDLRSIPFRVPSGQMTWDAFAAWWEQHQREVIAKVDARNPQNDFADAFVYQNGVGTIGNGAKLASQRPIPIVNAGNRLSAQTTNPLTSTGSASTAAVQIASHVVQYGGFTVSYNGGSISGLTPLTKYYLFADDPDYAGGAVAYAATTSPATVVASRNRYFVGEITTANSTPAGSITAATQANPVAITQVGHPFSTGNEVYIAGVVGMTQLNGNTYTITKTGADSYTLGVDGTGYTAYVSGGTATRIAPNTGGGGGGGSGWALP